MKANIKELSTSPTEKQMRSMKRVERLIYLKADLDLDKQDTREALTELAERRRETCAELGISFEKFDVAMQRLLAAYDEIRNEVEAAQYNANAEAQAA